jgi:hypothetical protein
MIRHRLFFVVGVIAVLVSCAPLSPAGSPHARTEAFPARLSDAEFWRLSSGFSEPSGSFPFDNFVSNEDMFQQVIPALAERPTTFGGAYLGVGPDQNLTYIVAFRPLIAFIVDIRRQNLLQHLLYKAVIELSRDRAEFLSRLFSLPRPPGLDSLSSPQALIDGYAHAKPTDGLYQRNLRDVEERLVQRHHFMLSSEDLAGLEYVYRSFFREGLDIHYSIPNQPRLRFPTYGELMQQTDGLGQSRGYLATEANFRVLKDFEERNLVVPVVGNFAGEAALPAVAQYLKQHAVTVRVFYLSNVEQYLFDQLRSYKQFYANLELLPTDADSTLIRTYNLGVSFEPPNARVRLATVLDSVREFLRAVNEGQIRTYRDVMIR